MGGHNECFESDSLEKGEMIFKHDEKVHGAVYWSILCTLQEQNRSVPGERASYQ